MKVSQKQASLLAQEILKELKNKKLFVVSDSLRAKVREFVSKREKLTAEKDRAEKQLDAHDESFSKLTGSNRNVRMYWKEKMICEELEKGNVPSLSELEDKIILKAMFSSEDDMKIFIESVIKEYTKKAQQKILQN